MAASSCGSGKGIARPGLTFHRTFPLSRPALAQVLAVASKLSTEKEKARLSNEELRRLTTLGVEFIPAMRRYAQAAGLVRDEGVLTTLGNLIVGRDHFLTQAATQWLMHYHLSAPQGPGPFFWHYLVSRVLQPGRIVSNRQVARAIADCLRETGQKEPTERALRSTATIFLGTYTKSDGLGALKLIENKGKGSYRVLCPSPPPLWVLAFTLADYWSYHWPNQVTVNLEALLSPGSWASLFLMDEGALGEQLQKLKENGVVDIYRVAPPYQVVRLWKDEEKGEFLVRAYA